MRGDPAATLPSAKPGTKSGWVAHAVQIHPPIGVRRSSGPSGRRFLLNHSLRTAVPVERIQVPTKLRHFRRREKGTHIAFGSACGCFAFLLSFSVCLLLCLVPLVSLLISVRSSWKPVRSALDRDHSSSREVSIFFPFPF